MSHEIIDHVLQILQIALMLATYLHHRKKVLDKKDPEDDRDFSDIGSQ